MKLMKDFYQLPLVDNTLGAEYNKNILNFRLEEMSAFIVDTDTSGISGTRKFPKCVYIHLRGSPVAFRARYDDFDKCVLRWHRND